MRIRGRLEERDEARAARTCDLCESLEPELPVNSPAAEKRLSLPLKGLTAALFGGALVPTAILFTLLWQGAKPPGGPSTARTPDLSGSAQSSTAPEIALSSPERIEAKAGEQIDFPLAIDATEKLPSRSVVAVSAMPDGASFSEGRPYGATGWSLRPDEIGELRFRQIGRASCRERV